METVNWDEPVCFEGTGVPVEVIKRRGPQILVKFSNNRDMYTGAYAGYRGTEYYYDQYGRFVGGEGNPAFHRIVNVQESTEMEDWS